MQLRDDERFIPADELPPGLYERVRALVNAAEVREGHTVPWAAGRSPDGKRLYPDVDMPFEIAGVKTRRTTGFHELAEWLMMNEGHTYDKDSTPAGDAHYIGNSVEKIEVEAQGGDWEPYCLGFRPIVKETDDPRLVNLPPKDDWDRRPYEDDDPVLLAEIDAAEKSTFAAPVVATSGLQNYGLEGAGARRRKRRKKRSAAADQSEKPAMDDDLKLFIPITKIDAAKRLVYGVATAEKPDVTGEICDYATTKPLYEKWSAQFAKATDGKSLGNLRVMHGAVAAGKLVEITFNDDAKAIEICGKVVDDDEWRKVEEGVYTGFSQGGKYVKRWPDPDQPKLMRYTADPLEVSLVDNPCLPEATFSVIKADGTTEMRKFKEPVWDSGTLIKFAAEWTEGAPVPPAFARGIFKLQPILKAGDPLYAILKDVKETDKVEPLIAKIAALADDGDVQRVYVHKRLPGKHFHRKAELDQALLDLDAAEAAKKSAAPVLDALGAIKEKLAKVEGGDAAADAGKTTTAPNAGDGGTVIKRDFTDDERKKLAGEGKAMKDGSFPIENKSDLENAIKAYGRAKNKAAAKRHIIRRAKALGATDMLPADWPGSTKDKESKKGAGDGDLKKGADLWSISDLLLLLDGVSRMEENAELPSWSFGNSVDLPKDLCDRFGVVLVELGDIAAEMLDIVLASIKQEEASEAVANAALASDLQKLIGLRAALVKVGAKHSKADKERIAKAHDLLAEIDPDCCPGGDAGDGEDTEKLAKLLGQEKAGREADRRAFEKQLGDIHELVKAIAAQPLPMGTSSVTLRSVEKTQDFDGWADRLGAARQGGGLERLAAAAQQLALNPPR